MGPGACSPETAVLAEDVGRRIAAAGAVLICGGRGGVMEAAARGASEAGGTVVGILPSDDEATASPFVTIPIITGMGNARNAINVLSSHAVIAIAGGAGTLSEIALAAKVGRPVVGLRTWEARIAPDGPEIRIYRTKDAQSAVSEALRLADPDRGAPGGI